MVPAPFVVVLDANVLYPLILRDTLLRAAAADFYQMRWSSRILDEVVSNLVENGVMNESNAARLRAAMETAFKEADVTGYEPLIDAMPNQADDRHVVAVAVKARAEVIVTSNLKDFAPLPEGVEAQSPDEFLCNLLDLDEGRMIALLQQQAADMKKPPLAFDELLAALAKSVPDFIGEVRRVLNEDPS